MKILIVDRIEENMAVCEGKEGDMHSVPLTRLPSHVKEGDCLVLDQDGYHIDAALTQKRRKEMLDLQNSLWN
nr:DUF3006 domain-containing protein [uncultured Solibaculum sp.]